MKKEQNGRELLRRLKPTVGCNASKRNYCFTVAIISMFCFVKCNDGSMDKYYHKMSSFGNQIQLSTYPDLFIQLGN